MNAINDFVENSSKYINKKYIIENVPPFKAGRVKSPSICLIIDGFIVGFITGTTLVSWVNYINRQPFRFNFLAYLSTGLGFGVICYFNEYFRRVKIQAKLELDDYNELIKEFRRVDSLTNAQLYNQPTNVRYLLTNYYTKGIPTKVPKQLGNGQ